jgi:hypothetical protein
MRKGLPNKVQDPYTIQDTYKRYLEKYPEGSVYYLKYSEYRDITTAYFKYLSDRLINKSLTISLPFRLGELTVYKHKPIYKALKRMTMDWTRSKELNKQVRQFNDHTNGFIYRFHWDRKRNVLENKTSYIFCASRANKREIARLIKTKQNDYFEKN